MENGMRLSDFLTGVGRPVAYYPGLRKITGSTNATIFLCQFIYWTGKENGADGWIYKTSDEIEEETGLSYEEQRTAREKLVKAKLIFEKYARLEHQMYFRVNLDELNSKWGNGQSQVPEMGNDQMGNKALTGSLISNSETTTENTSKREKPKILGIEAAIFSGRPVEQADLDPQGTNKYAPIIDELTRRFSVNFPNYGENPKWDRVVRNIQKDGRAVETFCNWAIANKRDPGWYFRMPDSLWADWPQAFTETVTAPKKDAGGGSYV